MTAYEAIRQEYNENKALGSHQARVQARNKDNGFFKWKSRDHYKDRWETIKAREGLTDDD